MPPVVILVFITLLKLTDFYCHAEPNGEASGRKGRNRTGWEARFFAALRMTESYNAL